MEDTPMKVNFKANKMMAFEYAVYMMAGSYFKKTICKNSLLEDKLRLHYLELKLDDQIAMENKVIQYMNKVVCPSLPRDFFKQEVRVKFMQVEPEKQPTKQADGKATKEIQGSKVYYIGKDTTLCLTFTAKKRGVELKHYVNEKDAIVKDHSVVESAEVKQNSTGESVEVKHNSVEEFTIAS